MRQIFWYDAKITEKIPIENKDQRKMTWPKQLTQNFACEQNHFLIAGSICVFVFTQASLYPPRISYWAQSSTATS